MTQLGMGALPRLLALLGPLAPKMLVSKAGAPGKLNESKAEPSNTVSRKDVL